MTSGEENKSRGFRFEILGAARAWMRTMSLEIMIVSLLAGIALGLRYKVLILVPAIAFAMFVAVITGIARADHFWSIVLAMILLGIAVQFGYFVGILMRAAIGSICARTAGGHNLPNE